MQIISPSHTHFFQFKVISVGFRLSDVNFSFAPSGLVSSPHMVRQHFPHLTTHAVSWHMFRSRKWGWNEGLGCSLMEPSWTAQRSRQKVIRLGERGAVCPPGPSGVPASHLCSHRMRVCGDYKLIVHGGPRGENHITGSVGITDG